MSGPDEMRTVLASAREAGRWTVAYTQLLLGYVRAFEDGLGQGPLGTGLHFERWDTHRHAGVPSPSTAPHARWAWDYFPLLAPTFGWRTAGELHVGSAQVELRVVLDSGWPEQHPGGEPDPRAFAEASTCTSPLVARGWVITRLDDASSWDSAVKIANTLQPSSAAVEEHMNDGVHMRVRRVDVDLADLPDRHALEAQVVRPIVELWSAETSL